MINEDNQWKQVQRFWIQEQAPDGGFFDVIGYEIGLPRTNAEVRFKSWQKSNKDKKYRLISRLDIPIMY